MAKWGGEWLIDQVKQKGGSGQDLNVMTVCNTGSLATSVSDCSQHGVRFYNFILKGCSRGTALLWASSRIFTKQAICRMHTLRNQRHIIRDRGMTILARALKNR